ncbi:hypothetical protein BH20PSE1_BH20PSE1_26980 [soil metagenome]
MTLSGRFRSGTRVERTHGADDIGIVRGFIGPISLYPRETQREAARILRARLQRIEGDFDDQLRPYVDGVSVAWGGGGTQLTKEVNDETFADTRAS